MLYRNHTLILRGLKNFKQIIVNLTALAIFKRCLTWIVSWIALLIHRGFLSSHVIISWAMLLDGIFFFLFLSKKKTISFTFKCWKECSHSKWFIPLPVPSVCAFFKAPDYLFIRGQVIDFQLRLCKNCLVVAVLMKEWMNTCFHH